MICGSSRSPRRIQAARQHARLSRLNQKHLNGSERQSGLELKLPPLVLVVIVAALMWVASYATPMLDFSLPAKPVWSLSLALLGAVVCLSGVVSFRRAKTTVNPMKPDSTSSLVVSGIYRYTRNPMYVGFALVLLGWAAFLSNVAALAFVAVFIVYMNRLRLCLADYYLRKGMMFQAESMIAETGYHRREGLLSELSVRNRRVPRA